jgi:hypothetical protein
MTKQCQRMHDRHKATMTKLGGKRIHMYKRIDTDAQDIHICIHIYNHIYIRKYIHLFMTT